MLQWQVTQLGLDPDLTLKHLDLTWVAHTHLPVHLDLSSTDPVAHPNKGRAWYSQLFSSEQSAPRQLTHALSPVLDRTVSFECSPKPTPPPSLPEIKSLSFIQTLTFLGFDHGISVIQSTRCETTESCITKLPSPFVSLLTLSNIFFF